MSGGKLCGRLSPGLLADQYVNEQIRKKYLMQLKTFFFAALLSFGASLFILPDANAITLVKKLSKEIKYLPEAHQVIIKGNLKDIQSNEEIIFANINVYYNDSVSIASATTNIDGDFEIKIDADKYPDVSLKVSYIGYQTKQVKLNLKDNIELNVEMELNAEILGALIEIAEPPLIDPFQSGRQIQKEDFIRMPKEN